MPILIYGGIIARAGKRTSVPTTGDRTFHSSTEDGPDHASEATIPPSPCTPLHSYTAGSDHRVQLASSTSVSLPFSLIMSFFMKTTEVCQGLPACAAHQRKFGPEKE
eukprot:scaffold272907_cov60-Attheya_sp.AAC.6